MKKFNQTFKIAGGVLGLGLILFFVLKQSGCSSTNLFNPGIITSDTVIVVVQDTTIVTVRDTIWMTEYKDIHHTNIVYRVDTVKLQTGYTEESIKPGLNYSGTAGDSTVAIDYSFQILGSCELYQKPKFSYRILKPITITKYIDREIVKSKTVTVTNTVTTNGFYFGGSGGYNFPNDEPLFELGFLYTNRRGMAFNYDFDLVGNTHKVGLKVRMFPVRN